MKEADVIALRGAEMGETPDESRQKPIGEYLLAGVSPADVRDLDELAPVRVFQPLLRELLLGGPDDFWVRLHVMRALLADPQTSWTQETLGTRFSYLAEEPRRDIIRRLTRGGWLAFADGRYTVTHLGETATALTGLLGDLAHKAGDLGLVVQSLKIAREHGLDSRTQLDQLRHKLSAIGEEMERAYDSRSEHAILQAREMLASSLPWVEAARKVLETYSLDTPEEHDRVRATHDLLSRLHSWASALQRALNDIGQRRIHLGEGGLTMRDITAFLAKADVDVLLKLGDGALHFPVERRLGIADNMLSEAEYEICFRELSDDERRGWSDAVAAQPVEPELAAGGPIEDFVVDARALVSAGRRSTVAKFVSRDNWATTAYRFTLLTMVGGRADLQDQTDDELAGPGRILASLPVEVEFDHTQRDRIESDCASEMTAGWIEPRPVAAPKPEESAAAGLS